MQSKQVKKKKCKSCGDSFTPWSTTAKVCSMACALDHAGKDREKAQRKEHTAKKREFYANDLPKQKELTQKVFNRLRKLQELKWFADRGLEPTCISCGKPKGGDVFCNGHFKTVGAQGGLRFDPMNSYLQHNRRCNSDLSGDIYGTKTTHGYIQGLKNRFGEDEAARIIEYCETNTQVVKWTCEELAAMRKEWSAQTREIESELNKM